MQVTNAARTASTPFHLPLVTLYLTDRCNSRCVTCDYWRHGRANLTLESLRLMLPELEARGTRIALLSGGEPLLNPQWREITEALRERGIKSWLLTSGLSLVKHARDAARLFESITVSLDGTTRPTYQAIRGLDAFDNVCAGIRAVATAGVNVGIRVTVQRANYRELPRFVTLARELDASQVSFLAVDVSNPHAFGRSDAFADDLALRQEDLAELAKSLDRMESVFAAEFAAGFIAESPRKLRRLHEYFGALRGIGTFPAVRCNAPEFSAVIGVDGRTSPCFFIPGPAAARGAFDLSAALDSEEMRALRGDIRAGLRRECERCVCSLWRDPDDLDDFSARPRRGARA